MVSFKLRTCLWAFFKTPLGGLIIGCVVIALWWYMNALLFEKGVLPPVSSEEPSKVFYYEELNIVLWMTIQMVVIATVFMIFVLIIDSVQRVNEALKKNN